MASVAHFIRSFGFGIFSVGLHLTLVVLCVLFATPAGNSLAADKDWIEVEMQPALGQPHGKDKGKDLGSHVPKPPPKMPEPEPFEAPPPLPPPDPDAIPTTSASAPLPDAGVPSEPDAGDAGMVEAGTASDDGGEYDPTTPVGSENVPPGFGSPDGVPGGQGTSIKKISPQYRAILAGWARARFPGIGAPRPEGPRPCAMVNIQISPGRQVTGASMSASGNAQWDQHVQGALGQFQGSTVPADPEGGPAPPSIGLNFCWD